MTYSYSIKINQLTIHANAHVNKEKLLESLQKLLSDNSSITGSLWIGEGFKINLQWDLKYWLKRCQNTVTQAFEYDFKNDTKIPQPLVYSPNEEEPQKVQARLPLTIKGTKSAFFLDRDGIVNTDQAYVYKVEDVEFVSGIVDFIQFLQTRYDYVIVLTNQSGVGRGYYKEEDVKVLHDWMAEDLEKSEARINDWYYCPYHPKGEVKQYHRDSYLRKPHAGMALWAAADHDLDLSRCAMVGDKDSDYLKDLQLETYLLQGNYELKSDLPKFDDLPTLRNFLSQKRSTEN